jgi:3-deoxy-D-manno-octulosonic-acid transferase
VPTRAPRPERHLPAAIRLVHPLLAIPYALIGASAAALTRLPIPGDGKLARAFRARRATLDRIEAWAAARRDASRPLLWMHAPSVGEGLQARAVLELLRERHPQWQFAYTWFSPSAERFASQLNVDISACLPFDTAPAARRLIAALRPKAIVFAKLDLWPRLADEARQRAVRLGMISATLAPTSGRSGAFARALLGDAYASLDGVGAIAEPDAGRLRQLGVREGVVRVTGDTRYDQVAARAARVDRSSPMLTRLRSERLTLVAGSTWPADEAMLLPAWGWIRRVVPDARLIIAVHEPTAAHLEPIEQWARDTGLSIARLDEADARSDVVLVDRVGVLGELYALADVAFVGGGFHAAGLHSVLEPAAYGVPVIFGPRHEGSRDAGLLLAAGGARTVDTGQWLTQALMGWIESPKARTTAGAAALEVVRAGLGAAARSAALVEELMR